MPELDYRALARRMRAAHDIEAQRENPQRLAQGGIPLADVLDLLTSDRGGPLERDLRAEAEAAVAETCRKLDAAGVSGTMEASLADVRPPDGFYPADPFRRQLARFFDDFTVGAGKPSAEPHLIAQAAVEALAAAAGPGGVLTDDVALAQLGPRGLQVLQKARALLAQGPVASDRPDTKLEDVGVIAAERLMRSRAHPDPLGQMSVLGEVSRLFGGPDALRGVRMAAVQHLFPSTEGLFHALEKNGLRPESAIIGGKGYSTDAETAVRLQAQGFGVHHMGRAVAHSGMDAEAVVTMMARDELKTLLGGIDPKQAETEGRKFLLLDEGGKLVRLLHEEFPQYAHLCVAVEQTDRGIQVLEEMEREGIELRCPVVNMARSEAKKIYEAPMIGESCVHNVELDLAEMKLSVDPKIAAVIGYGAVGKAVADRLRARGYEVWVYDTDTEAMARAAADGCRAPAGDDARDEVLRHGHLLYACTGRGPLHEDDYELLPDGAKLANAASGNHELGANALELARQGREHIVDEHAHETFGGVDVDLGDAGSPMRHGVVRTKSGKELLFMRSGYVCNMGRDIPPEFVQLIRALLLASCLQALKELKPGLIDVEPELQQFIVSRVDRVLAGYGTSLLAPDFRAVS